MANQLRLHTGNNLQRLVMPAEYPESIVLKGKNIDYFAKISELIDGMDEINGRANTLVLTNDMFFAANNRNQRMWPIIVDLLFPYELPKPHLHQHELFHFDSDGNPYFNPERKGVKMEDLREIIDYFLIGKPEERDEMILNFVYMRPGAPKRPQYARFVQPPRARERAEKAIRQEYQRAAANANEYQYFANENENNRNNYNNNEYQGPEIGHTEEDEEMLVKLKGKNQARYYRGGKRSTRRMKKRSKKTRKH
jgi:hypothetical protein